MVDIIARLKIRAEEFSRGADAAFGRMEQRAAQAGDRAGDGFARGLSARLDTLAAGAGVAAVVAVGQRALNHVTNLKKESQQLGISTRALQEYRFAAAEVGVEQDDLTDSFSDLTLKIGQARSGNKDASQTFKELGIDIESANGRAKSSEAVFNELIGRLSQVKDPAERARLEAQLFGEMWQRIDPMLSAGAGRIDGLRQAAHEFGAVISEEAIQNADQTARKVEQMKMVLEANIADAVARNSTAILGFTDSLIRMAGGLAQWWSQNPEQAMGLLGAGGGARIGFLLGGPQGAVVGAGVGYVAGRIQGQDQKEKSDDANMNLQFRMARLKAARDDLEAKKKAASDGALLRFRRTDSPRSGSNVAQAEAELLRQSRLTQRAAKEAEDARRPSPRVTTPTPTPTPRPASSSGGGRSSPRASTGKSDAERQRDRENEAEERLRKSLDETIQKQRDSASVAALRARAMDREADLQEAMLELQRQFPGLESANNAEAAKALKIREDQVPALREQYELLKSIRTAEVNREYDDKAEKERLENARKAQQELDRLREESAERQRRSIEDLARTYYDLFSGNGGDIWRDFKREGLEVISLLAAQWTVAMVTGQKFDLNNALGSATTGGYGGPATSILSALFNGRSRGSNLAELAAKEGGDASQIASVAQLGKGLGETSKQLGGLNKYLAGVGAGQAVSGLTGAIGLRQSSAGAMAGSLAGTAIAGPIGGAIGGLLGGTVGGLFKKTKKGSATISIEDGQAMVGEAYGNNAAYRRNALSLGGGVSDQLASIAEALGVDLTGSGSVSIGQRKKKFVVDTSGQNRTKGSGTMSFDTEEEAVEAAVRDMLRDGVLGPISAASRTIINSGPDLNRAVQKAALIESIPKALKSRLDPVGAAIDELNDRWRSTWKALEEGGASVEQMTDAQKLYNLELEDVKANTVGAAKGLKDFLAAMNAGSSSPLSLRDQEKAARDALAPYLDRINRGQSVDQDAYLGAAQTFLDVERQMYGSTQKYFEAFNSIQQATNAAISNIDNATAIRTSSDLANEATAKASESTAANTSNTVELLKQATDILQRIESALGGGSASSFIGTGRNFV